MFDYRGERTVQVLQAGYWWYNGKFDCSCIFISWFEKNVYSSSI